MAKIRSRDTKPEEYMRKKLYSMGYRYRKNCSDVTGHPDIWISHYNVAVFINGCFWHRHKDCKYSYTPKSRVDFWMKKFNCNIERDQTVKSALLAQNRRILIIWECTIKRMIKSDTTEKEIMDIIDNYILSDNSYLEI